MTIDISKLSGKVENGGANESGRLSASEFNLLVLAVRENQNDILAVVNQAKDNTGIIEKMSLKVDENSKAITELTSKVESNILAIDVNAETGIITAYTGGDNSAFVFGGVNPEAGDIESNFNYN